MNALMKCQFCLIMLLATISFIVDTATSDNRRDVSTGETKRMAPKPTIMILGSPHLAGWGGTKVDDMRTPKRQTELQQLADQIAQFQPTKIAVEVDHLDTELQKEYDAYLKGDFPLERHEIHQVGFRLAKQMGHSKIYCVDYWPWPDRHPLFPDGFDWDLADYHKFAITHGQEHLLSLRSNEAPIVTEKNLVDELIIDMYIRLNQPEWIRSTHQKFLRYSRIGLGDEYQGANWFGYFWYPRNIKTFVNLTRITESGDERILLVIGAGHTYLIQQFLEDSGEYIIESPLKYLKADAAADAIDEN